MPSVAMMCPRYSIVSVNKVHLDFFTSNWCSFRRSRTCRKCCSWSLGVTVRDLNTVVRDPPPSYLFMTFGKEFTRAVKQKQIAQQDAERARFTVEKVISYHV
jgi:hypothetical protein